MDLPLEQNTQPQVSPAQPSSQVTQPYTPPPPPPHREPRPLDSKSKDKVAAIEKAEQIFILLYIFVAALLLFRFVLSLFGANRSSLFVDFVYQLTTPFMFPFEAMFGGPVGVDRYVIEFEIIIALVVYALIFFGLARLVRIVLK